MDRIQSTPAVDLSAATLRLLGAAFARAFDQINRDALRDELGAGIALADALQAAGLAVSRPRPLLLIAALPCIDAPARVRRVWEGDDLEDTIEMPAPLHLMEAGE